MGAKVLVLWSMLCWASLLLYTNSTTQNVLFSGYNLALESVATDFILIHLVVQLGSFGPVPALLLGSKSSAPYAYIDNKGQLQTSSQAADLPAYALKKRDCYLQFNTSELHIGSNLYLGVMAPDRPLQGASLYLTVSGHGKDYTDGDLCPGNCTGRGTCAEGVCRCYEPWGDVDCSLRITYFDLKQEYNLMVGSDTYRYFTPDYLYRSDIHLSLKSLQGNILLLVSFGW